MTGKRIKALFAAAAIAAGILPGAAASAEYSDVYAYDYYYTSVNRLQDFGILSGYEDGTFHGEQPITRAEFAKVIVCAMDAEAEAKTFGVASKFYDVPQGNWAVPYIAYAASGGIVSGYPNGSFGPYNTITCAEALTVLGKLLGYDESTIGAYWPNNYMDLADNLGLTEGLYLYANLPLNRADASVLVDRALFTKISKTADPEGKKILLEKLGYTVLEDALVLATGKEDDSLFSDEVKLNNNSVYTSTIQSGIAAGDLLKYAAVNSDGDLVAVKHYGENGANDMKNGYTVLKDCYIIATAQEDRTLTSSQIRTSQGVFTVSDNSVLNKVGEVGTVVLDKDKKVLSASTVEAKEKEYIISEVDNSTIKYISDNTIETMNLSEDFPIYVDFGEKKTLSACRKDFVAGSELDFYSRDGENWEYAVLDTNSGYSVLNECFIIASKNEDATLSASQVRTSSGTYTVMDTGLLSSAGKIGTAVINSQNKIEQFAPIDMVSMSAVISKVNGNQIEYQLSDGTKGSYRFDNTFAVYSDYVKTSYLSAAQNMNVGTDITFYGDSKGTWSFAVIDSGADITPVLASKNYSSSDTSMEGIAIKQDGLIVYRDGSAAKLSDIQKNDVVYYNTKVNTMDVYTKKVTGIYYDALPSKAYVTSVTVGGKTYQIGETTATSKLDASGGSFNIGDKVTLLLGKNDEVVFAVELTDFDEFDYGVLIEGGKKTAGSGRNEGSTEIYAKLYMPDGETYEYTADKDYSSYKGKLVHVTYQDGRVKLSLVSGTPTYGKLDVTNRSLGGKSVLKDVKIIQRLSDEDASEVELETLDFDTLEVTELPLANVLASVSANNFGDVGILYVTGLSGSYSYGLLTKSTTAEPYSYTIFSDSSSTSYPAEANYKLRGVAGGTPVAFRVSGGKITSMRNLYTLASSSGVQAVETGRILLGGTIYKLSDFAEIIDITDSSNYRTISMDELMSMKHASVSVYSDQRLADGGIGKLLTVYSK